MSTLLICIVVVGGGVVLITTMVTGEIDKPATDNGRAQRGETRPKAAKHRKKRRSPAGPTPVAPSRVEQPAPPPAERPQATVEDGDEPLAPVVVLTAERVGALRRVRSGLALTVLLAFLGTATAIVIGAAVLALILALRNAVG